MLRFGCEEIIRTQRNKEIIVQERKCNNKVYCVIHKDFTTSTPIYESFERSCDKFGAYEVVNNKKIS